MGRFDKRIRINSDKIRELVDAAVSACEKLDKQCLQRERLIKAISAVISVERKKEKHRCAGEQCPTK